MMCSCRFPVFSPPTHSPQWPTGDKVGGPFGDSNRGGVRVAPDYGRHDRGVDHPQPFDAVHVQSRIDDLPDAAGAGRMVESLNVLLDIGPQIPVSLRARRLQGLALNRFEAWLFGDIQAGSEAGNHGSPILRRRQQVTEYARFRVWTRRSKRDLATAGRLQQRGAKAEAMIVGCRQCLVDKHRGTDGDLNVWRGEVW